MKAIDFTMEELMETLDHTSKELLRFKGFDIDTEDGLAGAAEWIKTATWNDAFYSENAPEDYPEEFNEIDMCMGTMRLGLLQNFVERKMAERGM